VSIRTGSRLIVAPDTRGAERALLDELALAADRRPLGRRLVVVPSLRLRVHLLGRLTEIRPAWLGLEIVTLRGLARTIFERRGVAIPQGDVLLPIVATRLAAFEPALSRPLGPFVDGYSGVAAAVRDLLDAGLHEVHLEAALELVAAEEASFGHAAVERVAALLRIAIAARLELGRLGLAPDSDLFAGAAELLLDDPAAALPDTQVFIHGIADATGVAADLLAATLRAGETVVVAQELRGPDGEALDFGRRLFERLASGATRELCAGAPAPPPHLRLIRVANPEAEAAIATANLVESCTLGTRPERAAVVARSLVPYGESLARETDRRALPASGEGGPAGPSARLALAWIELLLRRGEADLGLLLAAAGEALAALAGARVWEIRHAAAGNQAWDLATLAALAQRGAARGAAMESRLPVRDRMEPRPGENRLLAVERHLAPRALLASASGAARLLARLDALAGRRTVGEAFGELSALLAEFVRDPILRETLVLPLAPLAAEIRRGGGAAPPGAGGLGSIGGIGGRGGTGGMGGIAAFELVGEELPELLRGLWAGLASARFGTEWAQGDEPPGAPDGGADGGVALLSVTEARALTFDHLAILGLAHDHFPRSIRPDPFLPDPLRLRLRVVLPDLPVKAEGHDEERFLFAQLLGASPRIDLFAPRTDGEGSELAESSFLGPLLRAGRIDEVAAAAPESDLRPTAALAVIEQAALAGGVDGLEIHLAAAVQEARDRFAGGTAQPPTALAPALAAARLATLREFDVEPGSPRAARLGPFFGFVGPAAQELALRSPTPNDGGAPPAAVDPRSPSPAVTTLEGLATCGWQAFLERLLRLAPIPATGIELPALPAALFGIATHEALQRLAPPALAARRTLTEALAAPEIEVPWPVESALARIVAEAVRTTLSEAGLDPELFAVPLEMAVQERLAVARELDWREGPRPLLGTEISAAAQVIAGAGERTVLFRADRVEREGTRILFTDYKTGAAVSTAKKAATRAQHLTKNLASGRQLQLAAYVLAREVSDGAIGRLLFLRPDLADETRELRLELPQGPAATTLAPWPVLFAAWDGGAFLPRLLAADLRRSGKPCASCSVRVACVQGDSGSRLRLARWVEGRRRDTTRPGDEDRGAESAAAALFGLEGRTGRDEAGEGTP
jgi:hypothetical protein